MYKVAYIGNIGKISEIICLNDYFELKFIVAEKGKLDEELLTHSYLRDISIYETSDINDLDHDLFKEVDFCVMCSFGQKVDDRLLKLTDIYNIHFGILPDYKGRHPTFYSTLNSEPFQGLTLHKIDEEIDEGDLISVKKYPYYYWQNEHDVFEKNISLVDEILSDLKSFIKGDKKIISKNGDGEYYPPVQEEQKVINEYENPKDILNLVRVQSRYGGAILKFSGKKYSVPKAYVDKTKNLNADIDREDQIYVNNNEPIGIRINDKYYIRFEGLTIEK